MMLIAAPRTWYCAGAESITSALDSREAGMFLSFAMAWAWLRVLAFPSIMSVTFAPTKLRLPSAALMPGMLVMAS